MKIEIIVFCVLCLMTFNVDAQQKLGGTDQFNKLAESSYDQFWHCKKKPNDPACKKTTKSKEYFEVHYNIDYGIDGGATPHVEFCENGTGWGEELTKCNSEIPNITNGRNNGSVSLPSGRHDVFLWWTNGVTKERIRIGELSVCASCENKYIYPHW